MPNQYFQFKHFTVHQQQSAMKVTTDACLFGAWVAQDAANDKTAIKNALDIGTGTGLLSLMLSQKISEAFVDAVEIDKESYKQAKENIQHSPFSDFIHVIHRDAREIFFQRKYDVIISNPPFYEKELASGSDRKNIAHHSTELTLEELMSIIQRNLNSGGSFYLLLPYKRNGEIPQLLKSNNLAVEKMVNVRQSYNHDYFRIMLRGTFFKSEKQKTETSEISIWNEEQQYTEEFKTLLKDYYLHL